MHQRIVRTALLAAAVLAAAGLWVASPARAATGCQVDYVVSQWTGGFTANITLTAAGTAVNSWTVTWSYITGQQVSNAWSATVTQAGTAVTAHNVDWNGQVAAGGSVTFGLQGTYTTANPTPTSFALNGTPCNGGAAPSSPSSPAPSSPAPTSPSPSTGPTGSVPGGCGTAAICDGFETAGTWTSVFKDCAGAGTATVDTSTVHSGTHSLRVDGAAGYCNHVFAGFTAPVSGIGPVWFGRFYVRHSTALPAAHVTFMALKDSADGGNDLRMGGQNGALQWNRQSDDATLPAQSPVGVSMSTPLPVNQWECVEFMVNGTNGTLDTWLNGTQIAGLHEDGVPTADVDQQWLARTNWRPSLVDFRLGWESYGEGADTLWYDDVVLGATRIGC
jgi:hypothetical protein